jgi:hypothetical protein
LRSTTMDPKKERDMVFLAISLDHPAKFFNWGFISISIPNLIMIGIIFVLFALALVVPFPSHDKTKGK